MEVVKLKELVNYRKQFIEISDNKKYKRCRVQLHRRGVRLRDEVFGSEIKTKKQRLYKANDFIVAEMDAKFGGYGIIPDYLENAIVSSHYYLYELDTDMLLPMYLDIIIDSGVLQEQIKAVGSTNYSRVSAKEVLEYEIPCPSLKIQQQVINHYFKCKERAIGLGSELTHQQALLKKLRQQILQEAIEGKLTAVWREQNPDVEPASELLARIQAEKAQLIKDKKIKKQKPLPPISEEEKPFELPERWVWFLLDEVSYMTRGSSPRPISAYITNDKNGVNWIKIGDTKNVDQILINTRQKITREGAKKSQLVEKGDFILSNSMSFGKPFIMGINGYIHDGWFLIKLLGNIDINYFYYLLLSSLVQDQFLESASGAVVKNIRAEIVKKTKLPIPPLQEQKAIVAKVEKLLAVCDQLETQITDNQHHAKQLMQAVLKEAFSQGGSDED